MDKTKQLTIAKDLILEGRITEFVDIFNYIDRKFIHVETGMNYYRLLRSIDKPNRLSFDDVYNISGILKVPPDRIANLIINQIENSRHQQTSPL